MAPNAGPGLELPRGSGAVGSHGGCQILPQPGRHLQPQLQVLIEAQPSRRRTPRRCTVGSPWCAYRRSQCRYKLGRQAGQGSQPSPPPFWQSRLCDSRQAPLTGADHSHTVPISFIQPLSLRLPCCLHPAAPGLACMQLPRSSPAAPQSRQFDTPPPLSI